MFLLYSSFLLDAVSVVITSAPPYVKRRAHVCDFNTEFICAATDALFARQSLKGLGGALSQFYMQMSLHLGSGAGMLGAYLCKSDRAPARTRAGDTSS